MFGQKLCIGYILKTYFDDLQKRWLYDVSLSSFSQKTVKTLYGVVTLDSLGSKADFSVITHRQPEKQSPTQQSLYPEGSRVLVGFIDGELSGAVILGGINQIQNPLEQDENYGVYPCLIHSFNGIKMTINADGAFRLYFGGPKDNLGASKLSEADLQALTGSFVEIRADGSVALGTNNQTFVFDNTKDAQNLQINSKQRTDTIDGDYSEQVNGKSDKIVSGGNDNVSITNGNHSLSANNVQVEAVAGEVRVKAVAKAYLDGAFGNQLGTGSNQMLLGTTYRLAQSIMHQAVVVALGALSAALSAAGGQLAAAGNLMTTPTVGAVSASPFIIGAGVLLSSAVAPIAAMSAAIVAFESAGATYLSVKNSLD